MRADQSAREILKLIEDSMLVERKNANSCAVEGEDLWAMVHTYGEVLLDKILTKIMEGWEKEMPHECESCKWYDENHNGPHCGGCTSTDDHWEASDESDD